MSGLVVNFPAPMEDRFNIGLRDRNSRNTGFGQTQWSYTDIGENIPDELTKGINAYFELRPREYNDFFHWLNDMNDILGINFKFRYCNNIGEAYRGYNENNFYKHLWLTFK